MKVGVLFSGGKDSTYAAWLAKKEGYQLICLISIESTNKESFMFHTPSISCVRKQAEVMKIPLVLVKTIGKKESELGDLRSAIKTAVKKYDIEGVVTGAVESVYQASRIQTICNNLGIECFNPLWQRNQTELLEELIQNEFEVIISGVFAYPLDKSWIGRRIDEKLIAEIGKLNKKWRISIAGEGGEFESLVLNCPLFLRGLKVEKIEISGSGNSWRGEAELK